MMVSNLGKVVVVKWQGHSYWFDSLYEAEAFMRNVEDNYLYV